MAKPPSDKRERPLALTLGGKPAGFGSACLSARSAATGGERGGGGFEPARDLRLLRRGLQLLGMLLALLLCGLRGAGRGLLCDLLATVDSLGRGLLCLLLELRRRRPELLVLDPRRRDQHPDQEAA